MRAVADEIAFSAQHSMQQGDRIYWSKLFSTHERHRWQRDQIYVAGTIHDNWCSASYVRIWLVNELPEIFCDVVEETRS